MNTRPTDNPAFRSADRRRAPFCPLCRFDSGGHMKIKRTVFALVLGLVLSTAAIAGAATTGRVHWPATCSKFVCVNNHLNALSRRVHHANTRAMTPGPTGATGAAGAQGPAGSAGAQGPQ